MRHCRCRHSHRHLPPAPAGETVRAVLIFILFLASVLYFICAIIPPFQPAEPGAANPGIKPPDSVAPAFAPPGR